MFLKPMVMKWVYTTERAAKPLIPSKYCERAGALESLDLGAGLVDDDENKFMMDELSVWRPICFYN